jgi:hypothetical protein
MAARITAPASGKSEMLTPRILVVEYVPAAAPILGVQTEKDKEQHQQQSDVPGPPERPDHDPSIEEFVRDQHRSKGDDGLLGGKE